MKDLEEQYVTVLDDFQHTVENKIRNQKVYDTVNNSTKANQDKQINLTRNFHKISKKFMSKYKNSLKLSHF